VAVTGILLAAGRGERLRPLTDVIPKPALPLLDVPLGAWALARLHEVTSDVVVNVSHLGDVIAGALGGYGDFETLDEGAEPWGTGGTLAALRGRITDTALVCNADSLIELDPADLLNVHRASGSAATIAVRPVSFGADLTIEGTRAAAFVDRRVDPSAPGAQYLGVAAIDASALALLPEERPVGFAERLLRPLIERQEVTVYEVRGRALDVGTVARYLEASLGLLDGREPRPPHSPPGRLLTVQGGGAYLGPAATADAASLGPEAIVLAGATLQEGSLVSSAIVWPGEVVGGGERVHDGVWALGRLIPA